MSFSSTSQQGRPSGRPFLLVAALMLGACAHGPRRVDDPDQAMQAWSACSDPALPSSAHFRHVAIESGLPDRGQWRDGFDLADMNGDGHLDLLHGPARKGTFQPAIFLGDGRGHFEAWKEAHFPPLPYDYGDAKAADLNRDGRMDIVLSSHLRGMVAMINEAGGHYAPWGEGLILRAPGDFPDEATFASRSLALTDWNGDGRIDLLALNEGAGRFVAQPQGFDALAIYLNRDGYWEHAVAAQRMRGFGDALAVGDVDGDGRRDAVLGSQRSGVRLLLHRGTDKGALPTELVVLPANAAVTAVAAHDFARDGRDDIIAATRAVSQSQFCVGLQQIVLAVDGTQRGTALARERGKESFSAITHGDIDGDGHDDIVAVKQHGALLTFRGGSRGFSSDLVIPVPADMAGCDAYDARLVNLDEAPGLELIVSYAGEGDAFAASAPCSGRGGFKVWRLSAD